MRQVALQGVIEGATALVLCRQDVLHSQIMSILSTDDVPSSVTSRLTECLSDDGMFGRALRHSISKSIIIEPIFISL